MLVRKKFGFFGVKLTLISSFKFKNLREKKSKKRLTLI